MRLTTTDLAMLLPGGLVYLTWYRGSRVLIIVHAMLTRSFKTTTRTSCWKKPHLLICASYLLYSPPPVSNEYRLVELGSAPYKYVFLSSDLTLRWKLTCRPVFLYLLPRAHFWPPIWSWLLAQHSNLCVDKSCYMHPLNRGMSRVLAITTLPGLRHRCQSPTKLLLSKNLTSNCLLSLDSMWSRIWTRDERHLSLV